MEQMAVPSSATAVISHTSDQGRRLMPADVVYPETYRDILPWLGGPENKINLFFDGGPGSLMLWEKAVVCAGLGRFWTHRRTSCGLCGVLPASPTLSRIATHESQAP